jgi:hypothetical protein
MMTKHVLWSRLSRGLAMCRLSLVARMLQEQWFLVQRPAQNTGSCYGNESALCCPVIMKLGGF